MNPFIRLLQKHRSEIIFQLILHGLVFWFYSFDKNSPKIQSHQVVFFLNYALAAFFINYYLLPRFFYRKSYLSFMLFTLLTFAAVILVEELILEKIYFPDTRGRGFPGVIYTFLQTIPLIIIMAGLKFAWDAVGKQREVEALRQAVDESELQFLKSQINPHFLFNNLNNLYAYAIEQSPKTPTIILELSSVLRYMLYECREKYVPLSKELEHLQNFTQLNELQIEERGKVDFQIKGNPVGLEVAPLILVVFIENAFKHSQASQSENIRISILLEIKPDGLLEFSCYNNCQAQTNTDNLAHGIGLANVCKRLEMLYPEAHELEISSTETDYRVQLSLQLHQEFQP